MQRLSRRLRTSRSPRRKLATTLHFSSRVALPQARLRSAPVARVEPNGSRGLPERPFRYALIATLGVGVGLSILSAVTSLATVLTYVGIALFLSVAVDPVLKTMSSWGLRRGISAFLIACVGLVALVGLSAAVIPSATEQVSATTQRLVDLMQTIPQEEWFVWLMSNAPSSLDLDTLLSGVVAFLSDPQQLTSVGGGLLQVGSGIIGGVTGALVVAILTLYFVVSLPQIKAHGYRFVARSRRSASIDLTEKIFDGVGRYVGGQLLLALVNAAFTYVLTSLAGSPAPVLLAVIAFIGALIPVVGTVAGAAVAVLLTLTVTPVGALVVAIVMLIYMQIEAYVLSPRVMSRAVAVPGALVIIAALGGAALGGILGALVAVPAAAAVLIILDEVVLPAQERR
ncbi:AI-2E family transporter [Microbacterium sp. ZW T5_56]|uniref:AI-2E family transporter n=1 Tax=Microbacterium sp. ZW T5_56 TaxID=3378081 RepID=UPI003851D0C3